MEKKRIIKKLLAAIFGLLLCMVGTARSTTHYEDGSIRNSPGTTTLKIWNGSTDSVFIDTNKRKVGIGTTQPDYQLDVDGIIHAKNSIFAGQSGYMLLLEGPNRAISSETGEIYLRGYKREDIRVGIATLNTDNAMLSIDASSLDPPEWVPDKRPRGVRITKKKMRDGHNLVFTIGKADVVGQTAEIEYYHEKDGDPQNRLSLGFYSLGRILNVMQGGNVGIGTVIPDAKLTVKVADTTAVYGTSNHGDGVHGKSVDLSGVYGESNHGNGVYGKSINHHGVFGESDSQHAIVGKTKAYARGGVYGQGDGDEGWGVHGLAMGNNGIGVYGMSNLGNGVAGRTTAQYKAGVYGSSNVGMGVSGKTTSDNESISAIYGGNEGKGDGVHGWSQNRHGVFGFSYSSNHAGVYGSSDVGKGISGKTTSDNEWVPAIYGRNEGKGDGVYGWSQERHGVFGVSYSSDHAGIYAVNNGGGYAAHFNGMIKISGGADLSEQFKINKIDAKSSVVPGMVVSIDPENPGALIVSKNAYDRKVAGIISGAGGVSPGMLMQQEDSKPNGTSPVALTGRVYCLADASSCPIKPGDLLTTSDAPGHAMKVTDYAKAQGAVLGKAMTSLTEGRGLVLVLVSLQ